MHILISPNAFKNSLTASEAASAISYGLKQSTLDCTCETFPIGDGGDGTAELILQQCRGTLINTKVQDPFGRIIHTQFGLIESGKTAVIEMANASGIRLLRPAELDPLKATSYGTGEQITRALDEGVTKIIIGMGGSATVDGGTGILSALGVRFLDAESNELTTPESLTRIASIDLSTIDKRIFTCELIVLCDVDNTLLGEQGSAAIFGPQKGASVEGVKKLDEALLKLSKLAFLRTGKDMAAVKYGGTAGGAAAGLHTLLNARLVNGIDYFLQLTQFNIALQKADLVITGEGSIDEQTLQGKGPFGVAKAAKLKGLPVIALAGKIPVTTDAMLQKYFDVLLPIGHQPNELAAALACTETDLIRTAEALGNLLALSERYESIKAH